MKAATIKVRRAVARRQTLKSAGDVAGRVSIPLAPPGKALETMRAHARRRFAVASASLTLGAVLLSAAVGFLLVRSEVGGLTSLILGALLQVLGLAAAAQAAAGVSRAFPLSEAASSSRRILSGSAIVVLPLAILGAAAWLAAVLASSPVLLPAHPIFWGPLSAASSVGLVYAARELASERMAVVAAGGSGAVLAMALSSGGMALADPRGALTSPRLAWDLVLVAVGFLAITAAFERDPWSARSRRFA